VKDRKKVSRYYLRGCGNSSTGKEETARIKKGVDAVHLRRGGAKRGGGGRKWERLGFGAGREPLFGGEDIHCGARALFSPIT